MRCEKCSSPLTLSATDATQYGSYDDRGEQPATEPMKKSVDFGSTVTEAQPCTPPPYNGAGMSTVREASPYTAPQPDWQPEPIGMDAPISDPQTIEATVTALSNCPACGYPLTDGISECPYCKTPVATDTPAQTPAPTPLIPNPQPANAAISTEALTCPSCGATLLADAKFCQSCGSSIMPSNAAAPESAPHINRTTMGTVRNATVIPGFGGQPAQPPKPIHYCTLRRREWPGEMVKYTPTTYPGDSIVLNRMNTDQHNNTITSKQQAVITCENGQWYIEDRSTLQSTYVRVKGKVPIQPGDIILLGNREFEFEGF